VSEGVPVVVMTHSAKEAALRRALAQIASTSEVRGSPQVIRIERDL
jgi:hypothetical protein